mgnify:CR=1 FL=1|tara:strand:+ start:5340 stop:5603 length:264 start_codon:yes stop_codon:yes gene_type:complete
MKLIETYNDMIEQDQIEYREKNPKTDSKFRASSSGMCARKIYFESIEKAEPTNKPNSKSMRIMRLGQVVHEDVQKTIVKVINKKQKD